MSEYKRIISYIHEYPSGEGKSGIGYVKVQRRGGQWKFTVRMLREYTPGQKKYQIYLYTSDELEAKGVCLGELESCSGTLEWNGSFWEEEERRFPLELAQGIWIGTADAVEYVADWEGISIEGRRLQVLEHEDVVLSVPEEEAVAAEVKELESDPEPVMESDISASELRADEELQDPQPENLPQPESLPQQTSIDSRQEKWQYLTKHFPMQMMFQKNGCSMECIRIGPRDLQRLPRDSWILGNNSFLLHGYYQYRHLLLCRQECDGEAGYFLGVPGIYNEKEAMMAGLFGFADFRRSGNPGNQTGAFGYWFRKIEEA